MAKHFLLTIILAIFPVALLAQSYPDHTSTFVNDFADLIDPETEARIVAELEAVREERGVEMTVVTIHSRKDYGNFGAIEPFATGLFNYWGVGDATRNDGIMVLVAVDDRDMRIELGDGYPDIFDDIVKRVIDHHFLPYFKNDQYAEGIENGVIETIRRTKLDYTAEGLTFGSRVRVEGSNIRDIILGGGIITWLVVVFGSIFGISGFRRYLRNKPRICNICDRQMERLSEVADDAHLDQGQLVEESLKSKDYDVWYCRNDDHVMIEGYRRWFSAYSACPSCNYRTLHSHRTVLNAATTSSTGSARIDYDCQNCDYTDTETVTIPMISKTSSSSSSGGSFGGGSSSGGGASGSW